MRHTGLILIFLVLFTLSCAGSQARQAASSRAPSAVQIKRGAGAITVSSSSVRLEIDLASGRFGWNWGAQRAVRGATCEVKLADGSELKASEYARHQVGQDDIVKIKDGFGAGVKVVMHHRQEARPELRQTFWVYRDRPYAFVRLEVVSAAEIASNNIAPMVIEDRPDAGVELDAGDPLQVLFVPFDNDAFVRYNSHDWGAEADSYEVTAFYDNRTRHGLVVGSVSHDIWKTGFAIRKIGKQRVGGLRVYGGMTGQWSHDKQPHGFVRGTTIASPRIFVGWFSDWRDGMEAFGWANAVVTPPLKWSGGVPFGWNSWAAHKEKVTAEDVQAASDFLKRTLAPRGFLNNGTAYVNMDSYWDFIPNDKLLTLVARIHAKGQKAGIYWAPFVGWGDDLSRPVEGTDGRYTYRDIVLKDDKGNPVSKVDGGWPLDPTHPGTQKRWEWQFHRFIQWGFDFAKLDFMTHGALEGAHFDRSVPTGIAAYNLGMKRIAALFAPARIGRPFFLSLSIAPLFPSGYTHSRRVSCDTFASISSTEYMLNAVTYGWWTNGTLYTYNDPDHTVVYKVHDEAPVSEAEGRSRLNASVIAGTVLLNSDDLTDANARRRVESLFTNAELLALARRGQSFRPVEGDTGGQSTDMFVLKTREAFYVAVFNFNAKAAVKTLSLERFGLSASAHYRFRDLWTQQSTPATGTVAVPLAPATSTIFRVTKE